MAAVGSSGSSGLLGATSRLGFILDASLVDRTDKVLEVLHGQANRGQVIVLPEATARARYPDLVVALLRAIRKYDRGLKADNREKAKVDKSTFAPTDASETHRLVPARPSDWHFAPTFSKLCVCDKRND